MSSACEDDLQQRLDELEALSAIYGAAAVRVGGDSSSVDVAVSPGVALHVALPDDYPSASPPRYELSAPELSPADKARVGNRLDEVYLQNVGQCVVFAWVEAIREFLEELKERLPRPESEEVEVAALSSLSLSESSVECPEVLTGDCVEDRKSVFQGHLARVRSADEVKAVLERLMQNRKIANATHNMFAYRIRKRSGGNDKGTLLQDCDDDGEDKAGSRLLHLLEIVGAEDVLVVVSRWYGGIHLGPDRFKHINNAARGVLEAAGVVASSDKKGSKK